jgi:hypothetical protein
VADSLRSTIKSWRKNPPTATEREDVVRRVLSLQAEVRRGTGVVREEVARRKAGPLGRPRLGTPTQPGRRPAHHSAGVDMHDYARRMTAPDTQAPSTGGDRRYARSRDRLNRGALSTVARRKQELRHVDGRGERDRNPAGSLDPFQVDRRSRLRVHSRAWATLPTCLSMP